MKKNILFLCLCTLPTLCAAMPEVPELSSYPECSGAPELSSYLLTSPCSGTPEAPESPNTALPYTRSNTLTSDVIDGLDKPDAPSYAQKILLAPYTEDIFEVTDSRDALTSAATGGIDKTDTPKVRELSSHTALPYTRSNALRSAVTGGIDKTDTPSANTKILLAPGCSQLTESRDALTSAVTGEIDKTDTPKVRELSSHTALPYTRSNALKSAVTGGIDKTDTPKLLSYLLTPAYAAEAPKSSTNNALTSAVTGEIDKPDAPSYVEKIRQALNAEDLLKLRSEYQGALTSACINGAFIGFFGAHILGGWGYPSGSFFIGMAVMSLLSRHINTLYEQFLCSKDLNAEELNAARKSNRDPNF